MATVTTAKLRRSDLTPRIGSMLESDVETLVSGEVGAEIRALLEERGVVAFRAPGLSDAQQVTFTKTLGPMATDIFKISMDPNENPLFSYTEGAFFWHIDGTMSDVPIFASIMSCRRRSEQGGQTATG